MTDTRDLAGPGTLEATEIAPGIHALELPGVKAHLVLDDDVTLIDAGLPFLEGRLRARLARIGLGLRDVDRLVCTHGHPDHAGGAPELAANGAEVHMHPADHAGLQVTLGQLVRRPSRGRLFGYMTPTPAPVTPLVDGQVLPILGGTRVVHTPGHTPGSVCLYVPGHRLLFVGDTLEVRRGRLDFASRWYSDDAAAARSSVERLTDLDVETIVFSHYPPWSDDARGCLAELAARATSPPRTGEGGRSRWRR